MRLTFWLALAAIVARSAGPAWADTWWYEPKRTESRRTFGDSTIVQTIDATRNQRFPDFTFRLYLKGKLQAQFSDLYFDDIFAADDNSLFVGLSNDGLPGWAAMVIDRYGRVDLLVPHHLGFNYCEMSATVVRDWHRREVKIVRDGPYGSRRISLRDCHGTVVELDATVARAHARVVEEVLHRLQEGPDK